MNPAPDKATLAVADAAAIEVAAAALRQRVNFNADALVCAIVQQYDTGEVLMLAWMDAPALARTLLSGRATYWSRSRQEYWRKGDTSGHIQQVREVRLDCDADTVLLLVDQTGAACHTGSRTCFQDRVLRLNDLPAEHRS